jgi:hypothetical protein
MPVTQTQEPATQAPITTLSTQLKGLELRIAEMTAEARVLMIQYDAAPPVSGMAPRERIAHERLNQQIRVLRSEIATNEAQRDLLRFRLTQALQSEGGPQPSPGSAITVVPPAPQSFPPLDPDVMVLGLVITGLVLAPLALAAAWRIIRRAPPAASSRALAESNERMQRIEQTVEAIAIEVERVSEHQRFLTQAMLGTPTPLPLGREKEASHPTPV